jgi:hypothetical protein
LDDYSQRGRPLNCGVKLWDEIAKDRRSWGQTHWTQRNINGLRCWFEWDF